MMFDKMCGIIERHAPQYRKYMENANIFNFQEQFETISVTEDQLSRFFLPFDTVAIESANAVTVYSDHIKDQIGLTMDRTFIDCVKLANADVYEFTCGTVCYDMPHINNVMTATIKLKYAIICNKKHIIFNWKEDWDNDIISDAQNNASLGIHRLIYLNTVERFILEESPINVRRSKSEKITRSSDRPIFTLLKPHEIRHKLDLAEQMHQGGTKSPHERRRHTRTLRSDRFVNKKGQTLIIPATWIGDREKIIGNKKYIVRTDL